MATPKVSMTCRFACLKTSAGISADVVWSYEIDNRFSSPIDGLLADRAVSFCKIGLIEAADQVKKFGSEGPGILIHRFWSKIAKVVE